MGGGARTPRTRSEPFIRSEQEDKDTEFSTEEYTGQRYTWKAVEIFLREAMKLKAGTEHANTTSEVM